MDKVRDYKDLIVWQNGIDIVSKIYSITDHFPKNEIFGLTNQLRRASVSVPSNIAEGHIRDSDKEFSRFLNIALGSLAELETQLLIAKNLGYLKIEDFEGLLPKIITEIKQIIALRNSLKTLFV